MVSKRVMDIAALRRQAGLTRGGPRPRRASQAGRDVAALRRQAGVTGDAVVDAKRRAILSIRRTPRTRAPKVTGALRKSMRVIDQPNMNRFVLEFRIVYANMVDLKSRKNANYMQRVGRQAVKVGNRAAAGVLEFRFNGHVSRTTSGTGNKGWTRILLHYIRL